MKTLLMEVFVAVFLGMISISEGIRLVIMKKLYKFDIFGPGFYNIGLGAVLTIISLAYFVSERKKALGAGGKAQASQPVGKSEYRKVISMVSVLIIYIILMYLTGYLFSTFVFFLMINRIAGFRSWLSIAGVTVLMTAAFYLLFVTWMGIIFPRGLLFNF
ncbi:MAG: tripartite tricarboxylate transporter TctB family protein [Thermodesulfobacteriota bacterium]